MRRDLVVVGASAGGVEALRAMVHGLPGDLDAAVLVVLHIPAGAPSALSQILSRSGPLPAVAAKDGERITHGRVYVAVADRHMLVRGGRIVLDRGPAENGHRPAIDPLFRSAARDFGSRVIGIILSGSRDDGTAGLAAVVEHGGVPIVQDPETAMHRSMPCAAMENLTIDHVLHPSKIGRLVGELVAEEATEILETPGPHPPPGPADSTDRPAEEAAVVAELGTVSSGLHGRPSELSCPLCLGAMFQLDGAPRPRYRCRIGHAWSPESLLAAQGHAVDTALRSALRVLAERSALSRQLATLKESRFGPEIVDRHTARADHIDQVAEEIRKQMPGEAGYRR
jgi:two-component system chemotaxis response regulator CheB